MSCVPNISSGQKSHKDITEEEYPAVGVRRVWAKEDFNTLMLEL